MTIGILLIDWLGNGLICDRQSGTRRLQGKGCVKSTRCRSDSACRHVSSSEFFDVFQDWRSYRHESTVAGSIHGSSAGTVQRAKHRPMMTAEDLGVWLRASAGCLRSVRWAAMGHGRIRVANQFWAWGRLRMARCESRSTLLSPGAADTCGCDSTTASLEEGGRRVGRGRWREKLGAAPARSDRSLSKARFYLLADVMAPPR